jgi:hypothetical protein
MLKASRPRAEGVAATLRRPLRSAKLKPMCRMMFAALAATVALSPLRAQQVPGRDLFHFPLAMLAEPGALASVAGGGFWNPASLTTGGNDRLLLAIAALNSPIEQGVSSQLATMGYQVRPGWRAGLSVAQSSVGDLLRTDTDPLSIGDEIPYRSTIVSGILNATRGAVTLGVALRRRSATVDATSSAATSVDVGAVLERPVGLPLRAGLSSFLLSPRSGRERATALGAVEGYLPERFLRSRIGASYQHDRAGEGETFVYAAAASGLVDLRGGIARQTSFGTTSTRLRLALDLRHGHYLVGVAREEGTSGLGATYQFLLTTVFP